MVAFAGARNSPRRVAGSPRVYDWLQWWLSLVQETRLVELPARPACMIGYKEYQLSFVFQQTNLHDQSTPSDFVVVISLIGYWASL